jgi:hypothetical protein
MDVVKITTLALPGKPTSVGHLGTVVVTPAKDGEFLVEFTLRRKGMRQLRHPDYCPLDEPKKKRQNTGE